MGTTGLNDAKGAKHEGTRDPISFRKELERDLREGGATQVQVSSGHPGTSAYLARDWRDAEIELLSAEVAALRHEMEARQLEHERATARQEAELRAEFQKREAERMLKLAQSEAAATRLQAQYTEACSARDRLQAELAQQVEAFSRSLSWRITRPLRAASTQIRRIRSPR